MVTGSLQAFLRNLRGMAGGRGTRETPDTQQLERFVTARDEAAFASLVQRHGPMVLGVCRQLLHDPHDAEDAFQGVFLVLARKAGAIGRRDLLANWLYGVAYRVAARARANAHRRGAQERQGVEMIAVQPPEPDPGAEWRPVLHEELNRLPEKYRSPLVLCYLQRQTREEAARELGWTEGTVKGRLERARDLLRARLTRRGLALSAGLMATALAANTSAAAPAALLNATVKGALLFAIGNTAAGEVSASAAALAAWALNRLFLTTVKVLAAVSVLAGLSVGACMLWPRVLEGGDEVRVRNDIAQLALALQAFQTKYSVHYVPSTIILCDNVNDYYNGTDFKTQLHPGRTHQNQPRHSAQIRRFRRRPLFLGFRDA
jgi:RNA polymerase sigma factor (sigma-70 family)